MLLDDNLRRQQERSNKNWRGALKTGKEQMGNLQINMDFLDETKLLKADSKILEIGCGIGTIVQKLSEKGYDVIGGDISSQAVEYGRQKYTGIKLQVEAGQKLTCADNTFDIVLSFDLFEHIAETDMHLSEVSRVLRPGGYYLFQTPNKYSNTIFFMLSKKTFKRQQAHPSLHTPRQLRRRLAKHGFEARFIKMNTVTEFVLNKLKKTFGPVSYIFKYINFRILPLVLQTNLYVIAQKKCITFNTANPRYVKITKEQTR